MLFLLIITPIVHFLFANKVHNNENYNCIASRNYTDDDMETDICKSY